MAPPRLQTAGEAAEQGEGSRCQPRTKSAGEERHTHTPAPALLQQQVPEQQAPPCRTPCRPRAAQKQGKQTAAARRGSVQLSTLRCQSVAHLCLHSNDVGACLRLGTLSEASLRRRSRLAYHRLSINACRVRLGTTAAAASGALCSICCGGMVSASTTAATRRRGRTVAVFLARGLLRALLRTGAAGVSQAGNATRAGRNTHLAASTFRLQRRGGSAGARRDVSTHREARRGVNTPTSASACAPSPLLRQERLRL